jgi:acetyltransferase-like isoleucine patch superfamily enzyme
MIICYFIGACWSKVFTYDLSTNLEKIINSLYTGWIKSQFKSFGKHGLIQKKMYLKGGKYIIIGDKFYACPRIRLEAWDSYNNEKYNPLVVIGDNVSINSDCHIACINGIYIGDNVLIAGKVFITDHFHGEINSKAIELKPVDRDLFSPGKVIIEDNVWIGENVSIMPNVLIGENSIIGANSVVTRSFTKNSVVAGVPAKLIKTI